MKNDWLMAHEAVKFLEDHKYKRSMQWFKTMVRLGRIKRQKKRGRNFFQVSELKQVIKKKLKLKVVVTALSAMMICGSAFAGTPQYFDAVVDSIYLAEGGVLARKPFGILSVPCEGFDDCRKICYNTVRKNWTRWQRAGADGPYLEFLARRYAPIGVANDPTNLNRNWLKNVRYFLAKNGGLRNDEESPATR